MVADAVIYHPSVTHYLRYVATTVGRDKVLRLLQYFSRFYAWYLYRTNNPPSATAPFEATKKQFGLTRKLMRVGKFVEHFKAASEAADNKAMDPILKYCTVGRQLGYAGYMVFDSLTVLDATGIKKSPYAARLLREGYKAWFAGLVFNIIAGVYSLQNLRKKAAAVDSKEGEGVVEVKKLERERNAATLQLVSDLADLSIPLAALKWANLDDGFVGLSGMVSSLIGIYTAWKKTA